MSLLKSGDTLAVIDIHGVPAGAMIGMRKDLRGSMKIQVAKKRLMKLAWEQCGYDYQHLGGTFQIRYSTSTGFNRQDELIRIVH